jgi:hypothetical protein
LQRSGGVQRSGVGCQMALSAAGGVEWGNAAVLPSPTWHRIANCASSSPALSAAARGAAVAAAADIIAVEGRIAAAAGAAAATAATCKPGGEAAEGAGAADGTGCGRGVWADT